MKGKLTETKNIEKKNEKYKFVVKWIGEGLKRGGLELFFPSRVGGTYREIWIPVKPTALARGKY